MSNCIKTQLTILLVMLSFQVDQANGSSMFLKTPNAEQVIQAVCPSSNICDVKRTLNVGIDPCCTECDCSDGCIDSIECCFYENSKTKYETCLYLRTKFNNFFTFSLLERTQFPFYVVTKTPKDGCRGNRGMCDPSDTSDIYPVYSQKSRKLYFDKACAICHGVDEVKEPDSHFICDGLGSPKPLNFDEELSKFLEGDKSSLCFLTYHFSSSDIEHRRCSIHSVGSVDNLINITREDNLRINYNMSIEDIADACVSGFFSPTYSSLNNIVYPNPFCYLYGEGTHEKYPCFQSNGNPSGLQFLALLNPKVKAILPLETERQTRNLEKVCLKTSQTSPPNRNAGCRTLACPVGHIYVQNAGCIFFGAKIFNDGRMDIFLALILRDKLDIFIKQNDLINMSIDYLASSMHLPKDWVIAFWGMAADSTQDEVQSRTEIIIILKLVTGDVAQAFEAIKGHINSEVVILNGTFVVSVYGKTLALEEVYPDDVLTTTQCTTTRNVAQIDDDVSDCWKLIDLTVNRFRPLTMKTMNKLYFCHVVELMSGEYRLLANNTVVFNKILSKYLYDNEFLIQNDDNNKKIVKVCLEDSGFSRLEVNSSSKVNSASILPLLYLTLFSMSLSWNFMHLD